MASPFQTKNKKESQQNKIQLDKSVAFSQELEDIELASAMDYLKRVSMEFRKEPFKHQEFLSVLLSYKENEIGLMSMLLKITEIFSCHHSLLSDFNQFLPTSCQKPIEMIQKVKNETTEPIKNQIFQALMSYYQGTLPMNQLEKQIKTLLENYPTLLELFENFLPKYQTQSFNQQTAFVGQKQTNSLDSHFVVNKNSNLEKGEKQKNFLLSTKFENNPLFLNQYLSQKNSQELSRNRKRSSQEKENCFQKKEKEKEKVKEKVKEITSKKNTKAKILFNSRHVKTNYQNLKKQILNVLYFLLVLLPYHKFLTIFQLTILFNQQKITLREFFRLLHDQFDQCKLLAIEKYFQTIIQEFSESNQILFQQNSIFFQNSFLQNGMKIEFSDRPNGQLFKQTQTNNCFDNELISQKLKVRRKTKEKTIALVPNAISANDIYSNNNQSQASQFVTSRKRYFNENYHHEISEIDRIRKKLKKTHNYLIGLLIDLVGKMKKEKENKSCMNNLFKEPFLVQTLGLIYGEKTDLIIQNLAKYPIKACMVITKRIETRLEQLF
ncbi:paired amphipathic helix sin3-like protein-related [Anaeramoeba flamelloides]|uniref:Paired amphipathic helix sin3-like protein-related n=1 Tax=Anaeramoeba flamelloides TaxID=1746091 RepID=A0ABQ8XYW4_9EUKA|nr:paired amphipathic helix sin3-like protein-related [Anaeramoeba flamelloides]